MEYLHSSNIRFHGSLHSRSCVIDSRFVLKVTNFGLQSLKDFDIDIHSESKKAYKENPNFKTRSNFFFKSVKNKKKQNKKEIQFNFIILRVSLGGPRTSSKIED